MDTDSEADITMEDVQSEGVLKRKANAKKRKHTNESTSSTAPATKLRKKAVGLSDGTTLPNSNSSSASQPMVISGISNVDQATDEATLFESAGTTKSHAVDVSSPTTLNADVVAGVVVIDESETSNIANSFGLSATPKAAHSVNCSSSTEDVFLMDDDELVDMDAFDAGWSKRDDVQQINSVSIDVHVVCVKAIQGSAIAGLIVTGGALRSKDCESFRNLMKGSMDLYPAVLDEAGIDTGNTDESGQVFGFLTGFQYLPEDNDPFFVKTQLSKDGKFTGWITLNSVTLLKQFTFDHRNGGRKEDIMYNRIIWFLKNYVDKRVLPGSSKALQLHFRNIVVGKMGFALWEKMVGRVIHEKHMKPYSPDKFQKKEKSYKPSPQKSNYSNS